MYMRLKFIAIFDIPNRVTLRKTKVLENYKNGQKKTQA